MATKTLNLDEMGEIIQNSVDHIDDADQMIEFAQDIAQIIAKHFGGVVTGVSNAEDPLATFYADENVPPNGGVYAEVDTDVSVEEFMEDVEVE